MTPKDFHTAVRRARLDTLNRQARSAEAREQFWAIVEILVLGGLFGLVLVYLWLGGG